ncbi:MAG: hypothetical protein U0R66_04930 [Mycobacterium sp.]
MVLSRSRWPAAVMTGVALAVTGCGSARADTTDSLPPMTHFQMGGDVYGPVDDCRISDTAVTCTSTWAEPYQADTYAGSFTGTLAGLVMTGMSTTHQTGHDANDPACHWETETSAPITYTFSLDGTVSNRQEAGWWRMTHSGSCSGTESGTSSAGEGGPVRWTKIE